MYAPETLLAPDSPRSLLFCKESVQLLAAQQLMHVKLWPRILSSGPTSNRLPCMQRDLKPGNILLASQGAHVSVKIADFGFARALEPAHLASTLCGSPLYMAPEVLSEQQYDSRSDLWSVGVMMFEMLVGHVPFSGNNIVHLKKVVDSNEAFLPFDRREQLSPACQVLIPAPSGMRRCGGESRIRPHP